MNNFFNRISFLNAVFIFMLFFAFSLILHGFVIMLSWNFLVNSISEFSFMPELTIMQSVLIRALVYFVCYPNIISVKSD